MNTFFYIIMISLDIRCWDDHGAAAIIQNQDLSPLLSIAFRLADYIS